MSGPRANRLPSRGAASKGDGWGGEAKGSGAAPFKPGNKASAGPRDMTTNEEKAERLRQHIYKLAEGAEREETQLSAAIAWLNRVEGMPVARNLNINSNAVPVEDTRATVRELLAETLPQPKKDAAE